MTRYMGRDEIANKVKRWEVLSNNYYGIKIFNAVATS